MPASRSPEAVAALARHDEDAGLVRGPDVMVGLTLDGPLDAPTLWRAVQALDARDALIEGLRRRSAL